MNFWKLLLPKKPNNEHKYSNGEGIKSRNEGNQCKLSPNLDKDLKIDSELSTNDEIVKIMLSRQIPIHRLESIFDRCSAKRCVEIRREYYAKELEILQYVDQNIGIEHDIASPAKSVFDMRDRCNIIQANPLKRPQESEFPFDQVVGVCCENVVGHVRLPVGLVGPMILDNVTRFIPLATTEGCLVASTNRGLSVLTKSGGIRSKIRKDCMTRAPIVRFRDKELKKALSELDRAINWLKDPSVKEKIKIAFRSNSKHTTLIDYELYPIGREIHIRFEAQTGEAMGMNMCSKGAEAAVKEMQKEFPSMDILTLSGNMCTDKKSSSINWIRGRGKTVETSALVSAETVEKIFKVPVHRLVEVWIKKVMIGSALSGSIGGFNSQAANIVAAIFIATGQDVAQVIQSSNCLFTLDIDSDGSLEVFCTMPSIECGIVGGGTILPDQNSYLRLMGIKDARTLARVVCASVMAAELSLLASLADGTLVKSHMACNRKK